MHPYTRMPIIKVCERVRVCLLNGTFESIGCLLDFGAFPQCLAHAPTVRQQCYSYMSSIKTKYNIQTVCCVWWIYFDFNPILFVLSIRMAFKVKANACRICMSYIYFFISIFKEEFRCVSEWERESEWEKRAKYYHTMLSKFILWID